ncbi:MAG: hypothetical protein PSX80_05935 [bacterium]|nr:hypothetical protein [bacterium]
MRYLLPLLAGFFIHAMSPYVFGQLSNPLPSTTPKDQLPSFQKILDEARKDAVRPGERGARNSRRDSAEARRKVKADMEPERAVTEEFAELLKTLNARMVRLHPDFGCESKHTLRVDAKCYGRVLGASRYEGIHYDNGKLVGDSFFTIFMIADVGEVPFKDVDTRNARVKLVSTVIPPTEFVATRKIYETLAGSGITVNDLHISDRIPAAEGTTFVVRSVAYKASGFRSYSPLTSQIPWQFLGRSYDGWHDEMFAAKVVRRSADGIIHLLWRRIIRKPPPTIRFANDEMPTDFRTKGQ